MLILTDAELDAVRQAQDAAYKEGPGVRPHWDSAVAERDIRSHHRTTAHSYLMYTTRGRRGEGRTNETILNSVRFARRQHSESIVRQFGPSK